MITAESPCAQSDVQMCPGSQHITKRSAASAGARSTPPADRLTTAATHQELQSAREFEVFLHLDDKFSQQSQSDDEENIMDVARQNTSYDAFNDTSSNATAQLNRHTDIATSDRGPGIATASKMPAWSTMTLTSTVTRAPAASTRNVDLAPSGATNGLDAGGRGGVRQPATCEYLRYMR